MKHLNLKYAPNLSELLDTFDRYNDISDIEMCIENNYVIALLELGIFNKISDKYVCNKDWQYIMFSPTEKRYRMFTEKLSEVADFAMLLQCFHNKKSPEGYSFNQLKDIFNDMPENTLRTILDWMLELHVLDINDENYVLFDSDSEDEGEDAFSSDEEINIKEDKFSIYEYLRKIKRGYITMNPDFQRNIVWKVEQKSRFIESILMGLPLPPIFLKKESDKKFIVVDGLQRSATLLEYFDDKFELTGLNTFKQLNGKKFSSLDDVQDGLSARLEDRQLYMYVMQPSVSMSMVYDVFNRINTGGTQLTRQEIRNCVFHGNSTTLLNDVSSSNIFKLSIDHGIKPLRMKDREALLRCLAFSLLDSKSDYRGSMDDFLAKAMKTLNDMDENTIEIIKTKTLEVFKLTYTIFGHTNFRIPTGFTRGRVNIAVMESVFCYFYKHIDECMSADRMILQKAFDELLGDKDFINAARWSTSSKVQVMCRFEKVNYIFNKRVK